MTPRAGLFLFATVLISIVLESPRAEAGIFADATNDFLSTYTGTKAGDLDVTAIDVTFDGTDFILGAWMNGDIGTTKGASYVWGVDRGKGTARFSSIGIDKVFFDSIVNLTNTGTGTVNRIVGGGASTIDPSDITIKGNFISAKVHASFLPTLGFDPRDYTFNLWPRLGAGNAAISDFAPDNANIAAAFVPEPTTLAPAAIAAAAGLGALRRRIRRRTESLA